MCETMGNIPVEEKSSYVLTEDMIDAAMNQQFAYQDDIESEGESSSLEDDMEVDQDSQESCVAENTNCPKTTEASENIGPTKSVIVNSGTLNNSLSDSPMSNGNKLSVLVIETGLDKCVSSDDCNNSASGIPVSQNLKQTNTSNNCVGEINHQPEGNVTIEGVQNTKEGSAKELPILKKILSDKQDQVGSSIEPIDLCDSDTDFTEEDEYNEVESIDDELKSVMESNLMAEIGMTLNKRTDTESSTETPSVEKQPENVAPKISVKSIEQISTNMFNSIPPLVCNNINQSPNSNNLSMKNTMADRPNVGNFSNMFRNFNGKSNIPVSEQDQGPSSIHISKIAVPHSTFVNRQGQKMKCVYVKSPTTLPVVINTNQPNLTNKNLKYMLTTQVKKGPLPPLAALKNMTKQNLPQQRLLLPKSRVMTVAQKLQRPPPLQNVPSLSHQYQFKYDQNLESLTKTLIFHSLNKPYSASETMSDKPTYACIDCKDKFILKSSLTHHLARRTISIRYWCQLCKSELQFYNRCALLIHLRGHNNSLKVIDTSCISFSPIPQEMIDNRIVTTFLKESISDSSIPSDESLLPKSIRDKLQFDDANNKSVNAADPNQKSVSVITPCMPNQKITTVAGQSKSICYQTPNMVGVNKNVTTNVSPLPPKKGLTSILKQTPKPVQAVALVTSQSVQSQTKDQSTLIKHPTNQTTEQSTPSMKPPTKSVILFCNKLSNPAGVKQNAFVNTLPPNVVCESSLRKIDTPTIVDNSTDVIVDDDTNISSNNVEEELVDVEHVEGNLSTSVLSSTSAMLHSEPEKKSSKKTKNSPLGSSKPSTRRVCSECGIPCLNISKHLNGSNRPIRKDLTCNICSLILPTKCALKIHHRVHMKMAPYKCPDCGKDFTTWDEIYSHLKFSCGHFAKCVRYMCGSCKVHFPSSTALGQHITKNHSREIFKCNLCPVAFYNKSSLNKHILSNHGNEANKSMIGMDYKQCSMCPKKLLPVDKFPSHVQEHTSNNHALIYGYKCPMCSMVYANKMAFIIHQIKEKNNKDDKDDKAQKKKTSFVKSENQDKTISCETMEESAKISDSNSDFEDEPEIVRKYPENNNDFSNEKDPLSLDDWECAQEQKVNEKTEELCIVCKKNSVFLLPGIDLNNQSLCCKQCVKPIVSSKIIKETKNVTNSVSKSVNRKQGTPRSVHRSSSFDEMKIVQKKRRASDVSANGSPESENSFELFADVPQKKKSRKKQKQKLSPKSQTHIQGQVITSKSPDELICSKCEFIAETREAFLEHITVHRTDPNTYQCLECGLCFVVLPSLERHLQMHHSIKDVSRYTETNKSSLPQKFVPVEEETDDNQCRVCYEMFDSHSSLEKHFRTHGMAFMSRLSKSP